MRLFIGTVLFFTLALSSIFAQAPSQTTYDAATMEQVLKEAGELQSTAPQSVAEKLAPLLTELRQSRQSGTLGGDASRILKDALLLMMRTQIMLLAPEQEILALVRELLITDPKIDEGIFNPREKLLLNKIRSAETGSLSLETSPPGAVLSYLGAELGTTPVKVDLIAGSYRFQLRLPGYLDQDVNATIQPAEVLTLSRNMRRRTVDIPISINVSFNDNRFQRENSGKKSRLQNMAGISACRATSRNTNRSFSNGRLISPLPVFSVLSMCPWGNPSKLSFRPPVINLSVWKQK